MLGEYGQRQVRQADGIHPNFDIYTLKLSHEFDSGWTFDGGLRHSSGSSGFKRLFTGNDTTTAARFNNARFNNDGLRVGAFYPTAHRRRGLLPEHNAKVADSTYLDFLIPFVTTTAARSTSLDLKLGKSLQWKGDHQVTVGAYLTDYSSKQNFQQSLLVSTIGEHPQLVELRAVDAAGNPVGPSVTSDGVMRLGFQRLPGRQRGVRARAIYLHDHWETLEKRLKLDSGCAIRGSVPTWSTTCATRSPT
jgi:hypothetical protein